MTERQPTPSLDFPGSDFPRLAMSSLFATEGVFPPRDVPGPARVYRAMVHFMAAPRYTAFGAAPCAGQRLSIPGNTALFSLLGTSYGGNGATDFALPNLSGRVAVGDSPGEPDYGDYDTLPFTMLIAAVPPEGGAAWPAVGTVAPFPCGFEPMGWLKADGRYLAIAENPALFKTIGTTFGGDGPRFKLPFLPYGGNAGKGTAPVGTGQGTGAPPVALGQRFPAIGSFQIPGLGLNYIVCTDGVVPPDSGNGAFPDSAPVLGEVTAFAGTVIPPGWMLADGRYMDVFKNQALFRLIGTTYGGDGKASFALPDLRGRMVNGRAW